MQLGRVEKIKEVDLPLKGEYVLYWMHAAQRLTNNHALEAAIQLANRFKVPLLVGFVLMPSFPNAQKKHFNFMYQGLKELVRELDQRHIGFVCVLEESLEGILKLAHEAILVVLDKGYTAYSKQMRETFVSRVFKDVYLVDTNVVVPVHIAYPKEAYAAYAIRNALMKKVPDYAIAFDLSRVHKPYPSTGEKSKSNIDLILHFETGEVYGHFIGGETQALNRLDAFIGERLSHYAEWSSAPEKQCVSELSPYLHFGQISPITIYEKVIKSNLPSAAFIEQLIVRRELAYNFVHYNENYNKHLSLILPDWAQETLEKHSKDHRTQTYTLEALENAKTHDPYWNAAQNQMLKMGYMHNYMRMYWGKKIIEWTSSHQEAFETLLYLNDKYELDGRDPNGYAGIAWCFGKHDRPFMERAIFGKVRYMAASGLEKKFDIQSYVKEYGE